MTDRGRQVIRQWKLLRLLESSQGGKSVGQLHELVEEDCNERTVRRDLAALEAAGFPLYETKGRWRMLQSKEGGWAVPIRPTELCLVALSEDLLAPLAGTPLADPLHDLRQKLMALLSPAGRAFFERLRTTSIATVFAPGSLDGHSELLGDLFEATNARKVVRLSYKKPSEARASSRDVEPLTVWYHDGSVRLLAYCRRADGIRQFVVQRIEAAEVLNDSFEPPPNFDAAQYVRESFGVFHGPLHDITIDFAKDVAYALVERRFHSTQQVENLPEGGVRLTMRASGLTEIAAWVAGFGGTAVPRSPPALVAKVRRLHETGLAALGSSPS